MTHLTNYEDRVTIFLDILGFKQLLNNTVKNNEDQVNDIIKLQEVYDYIYELFDRKHNEYIRDYKVTVFSDCIVISVLPITKDDISLILLTVKTLIMDLTQHGILLRGAITYGKLIHTDRFVFGPALVQAYILESKSANYPRVIVDFFILASILEDYEDSLFLRDEIFKLDLDGLYYIDYFNVSQYYLVEGDQCEKSMRELAKYLFDLKAFIADNLIENKRELYNKVDVRVKYLWMKTKFNHAIKKIEKSQLISQDVLDDYFRTLKIKKWV